jgi:hypothetical protein
MRVHQRAPRLYALDSGGRARGYARRSSNSGLI